MTAQAIFPLAVWPENIQQARFPANDNALRLQAALSAALTIADSEPGAPEDGDQHIVGTTWGGFASDSIVVRAGGTWLEYLPFPGLFKTIGGDGYQFTGSAWEQVISGGGSNPGVVEIITISDNDAEETADPADIGKMYRFTGTGSKELEFDDADDWEAGQIIHVCNDSASGNVTLVGTGITLVAPKGGTLVLEPGDTVSVHFTSSTRARVYGSTEDA